jgi:dCMP deaminase
MSNKWDEYFLRVCKEVGTNSKCMSRHVGAIIVKDKSIISTGYNGGPRGVPHCSERYLNDEKLINIMVDNEILPKKVNKCPRQFLGFKSGMGLEWCIAGHAERNALINAARHGIAVKDATMYMDCGIPCTPCLIEIINATISEIVVIDKYLYYDTMGEWLIKNSDLKVREYEFTS